MTSEQSMMIVIPCLLSCTKERSINPLTTAILFLTLWLLPDALSAQCASAANTYAFVYSGKSYEVVRENRSWSDAAACALQRGGKLAEIETPAEQAALYSQLATYANITITATRPYDGGGAGYVWIGGTDRVREGTWMWDGENSGSGTQFWQGLSAANGGSSVGGSYTNWGNEPDNYGGGPGKPGQDALAIALSNWPYGTAGQWNDLNENNQLYYIIEYPNIVPVELTLFIAERYPTGVQLSWRTASETNNLGWGVERRTQDGLWRDIAFVSGAGTSSSGHAYQYLDTERSHGSTAYRLRQMDMDGQVEYSPTVSVDETASSSLPELLQNHPNPFSRQTTISYFSDGLKAVSLVVTDAAGREVMRSTDRAGSAGLRSVTFDPGQLPAGIYFYRLESGRFIHTRAMLLVR